MRGVEGSWGNWFWKWYMSNYWNLCKYVKVIALTYRYSTSRKSFMLIYLTNIWNLLSNSAKSSIITLKNFVCPVPLKSPSQLQMFVQIKADHFCVLILIIDHADASLVLFCDLTWPTGSHLHLTIYVIYDPYIYILLSFIFYFEMKLSDLPFLVTLNEWVGL